MITKPIYDYLERGIYRANYIPRGKGTNQPGVPGAPYNPSGFVPWHQNFFTTANQSIRALEQEPKRTFLQIENRSLVADIVYAFGKQASLTDGITLSPGQVEIFDVKVPVEALDIFCASGGQRVHLVVGV